MWSDLNGGSEAVELFHGIVLLGALVVAAWGLTTAVRLQRLRRSLAKPPTEPVYSLELPETRRMQVIEMYDDVSILTWEQRVAYQRRMGQVARRTPLYCRTAKVRDMFTGRLQLVRLVCTREPKPWEQSP